MTERDLAFSVLQLVLSGEPLRHPDTLAVFVEYAEKRGLGPLTIAEKAREQVRLELQMRVVAQAQAARAQR